LRSLGELSNEEEYGVRASRARRRQRGRELRDEGKDTGSYRRSPTPVREDEMFD
jgi:hypothetical protein